MYNYGGTTTLTDCTLSGNSANAGGALCNTKRGTGTMTSCTISGNTAAAGGGLYNSTTENLYACTIGGNYAAVGGGIDNAAGGGAMLEDTIVATNTGTGGSSSDIGGENSSGVVGTYDLVGTGGAGGIAGGTGDIVLNSLTDLGLAPLANYGGPTETMALLPGSAAIGAGAAINGITTDQRGYDRIVNSTVDIGAFEAQPIPLVVNTAADGAECPLGELDLRGAVNLANIQSGTQTITFDPTVFATAQTITLTQGQLELSNTSGTETIMGPGAGVTVSGGGISRVFQIDSGVTASISGLTISGGSTTESGGGLANYGTTTLTDCALSGNSAGNNGGAIDNYAGPVTLTNCTISGNFASSNGGGFNNDGGAATLTDCTISGNSAQYGGGLYNSSTAALTDTIVAGNSELTGGPSDIGVSLASAVTGSYNLIGTGGSGGITNGSDGNVVLTSLTNLGLAPLGDYGGPTETMALLPGSAAISAGTANSGVTSDQRGAARPLTGAVDIGGFQDQGYTLAVWSGSPQTTLATQAFNAPLVALLTENFASAPLPGATIDFSAPSSGASATLSAISALTGASGLASLTATANATVGTYAVTASATGVTPSASFELTNQVLQPSFSGLIDQTITYGSTVTFTGTLAAGLQAPAGEDVAVTLGGVTRDATIAADGWFSIEFTRADVVLSASSTAYDVTYVYATDGGFFAAEGSSQLTVNPEALTITAVANTKVYDGTTSAAAVPMITSGSLAAGDTADFSETYNTRDVGTGLMLTPSGTVDDGNGGNNYTYSFVVVSTGTITPAPLLVRANNISTAYGSAPALTYAITGFIGGDNSSVVSGAPRSRRPRPARASAPTRSRSRRDIERRQLHFLRGRPDRRHADRDAGASCDHGRLDEHVRRRPRAYARGGLLRIRQRRHAGQSHAAAGPFFGRQSVGGTGELPHHRQRRGLTQLHDHICARHAHRDPRAGDC